ncbi:MAG TPA: glycosyltransferase family 2 protein [Solirubrobacteraceae bacterium]|nr:glycosyltransferase family 2 protein [Solirubrobacteraceae bacterium]
MTLSVAVIVPLHRDTPAFRRCVDGVLALADDAVELVVAADRAPSDVPPPARVVLTGSATDTSPAEKRDAALETVTADVCAFIDDDAYPAPDWIEKARARLADPSIAAVGGPGVTPPGSPWRERVGGAFYESSLGSGPLRYRFVADGGVRDVDDFPAYNFLVRTQALRDVGGWGTKFYGGEDTAVCLALHERGHRIVYDPEVVVFHHRRPIFRPHMRQVGNVGRHRGYFVRAYPKTSLRPVYFAPSLALVAAAATAAWALPRPRRRRALAAAAAAGWAGVAAHAVREGQDPPVAAGLPAALAAGHGAYGWGFLRGLVTPSIEAM